MNVLLNKDISKIHETVFFGLPLRETVLGGATIAIALIVHKVCYEYIIDDTILHLVTALACAPTAFLMVYKYQGLKGEQLFLEFVRSMFLGEMVLTAENDLHTDIAEIVAARTKEGLKNDKVNKKEKRRQERKVSSAKKSAGSDSLQSDL